MAQAGLTRIPCSNCQYSILRSFVAIAGVSLHPLAPPRFPTRTRLPQHRPWSQLSHRYGEQPYPAARHEAGVSQTDELNSTEKDNDVSNKQEEQADQNSTYVPWYLQVPSSTPSRTSSPLNDRQKLPDLPEDPPPILSPLLNHLFEGAGLDDLSIIDLRHLNPPPALGSNLVMILGTARSIKHLNVSADRLCRWLRSEYKLRPYADGLLGRNELKIKLRRRAKRAKLASSVGRQLDDTNRDDGITTGWICVNVGAVPGADEQNSTEAVIEEEAGGGFVGFGTRDRGPRVVVQIFTEEKRAELDLEGLWDHRQVRRGVKDEKYAQEIEAEVAQDLEKAFDGSSRNVMADMNPPPEELRDHRSFG